ncbi:hypothetical protein Gotur_018611 [Gossypium turneri]
MKTLEFYLYRRTSIDRTSPTIIFWKDFYRYKIPSTNTTKL